MALFLSPEPIPYPCILNLTFVVVSCSYESGKGESVLTSFLLSQETT